MTTRPAPSAPARPGAAAGIGLRGPHIAEILRDRPPLGWVEIHPENYCGGGRNRHALRKIREHYPVSFHAVGLSLGADRPVDAGHLAQIAALAAEIEPFMVSDHVAWSVSGNAHFNDLLPLPYTHESLARLCDNIQRVQEALRRPILIENPSSYLSFTDDDMDEAAFINEAARRTGCFLLIDINNVYVQAQNHGFDARAYIDRLDAARIREFHLAGHSARGGLLVDTHNAPICDEVWDLFAYTLARAGPRPALVEWDADLPPLAMLAKEAQRAQHLLDMYRERQHDAA